MSYLGVGVSPGNVPIHHNQNITIQFDRKIRVIELVLRFLITCLALLAVVLVATDSQVKVILAIRKEAKFTNLKALVFLVVANGIAAGFSVMQFVRCVVSMVRGTVLLNKPLAWVIFSADQIMAYLTLAAVVAPMQAGMFSKWGQPELQWMQVCNMFGKFCNQVTEGVAAALFASIGMVILSAFSAFALFRLYGNNKGKFGGRW